MCPVSVWNKLVGTKEWLSLCCPFYRGGNLRNTELDSIPKDTKLAIVEFDFQLYLTQLETNNKQAFLFFHMAGYCDGCKTKQNLNEYFLHVEMLGICVNRIMLVDPSNFVNLGRVLITQFPKEKVRSSEHILLVTTNQ